MKMLNIIKDDTKIFTKIFTKAILKIIHLHTENNTLSGKNPPRQDKGRGGVGRWQLSYGKPCADCIVDGDWKSTAKVTFLVQSIDEYWGGGTQREAGN